MAPIVSDNCKLKTADEPHKVPGSAGGQLPGRAAFTVCLDNGDSSNISFKLILISEASSTPVLSEQAEKQKYRSMMKRRDLDFMGVVDIGVVDINDQAAKAKKFKRY